jgi:hypothetical protein
VVAYFVIRLPGADLQRQPTVAAAYNAQANFNKSFPICVPILFIANPILRCVWAISGSGIEAESMMEELKPLFSADVYYIRKNKSTKTVISND